MSKHANNPDRRQFTLYSLGLGLVLPTIPAPAPAAEKIVLKVADSFAPAHYIVEQGLKPWMKRVTELTGGQVEFQYFGAEQLGPLRDLDVEFAGLNLHKWIGSPLGVGLVYVKKDRIPDIDVSILEGPSPRIDARVHTGTVNYATMLSVGDAIAVHDAIGPAAKARRLSYLRDRWAEAVRGVPDIEVLTPNDPTLHAGITSFRLAGKTTPAQNVALRKALFDRYRIFTVERAGPARGACIRVTPSFVNSAADMDALVAALREVAKA